jgi:hypothetical protein
MNERVWLQTRAALWSAIRQLGTFNARELQAETHCSAGQVNDYLTGLANAGILVLSGTQGGRGCIKPSNIYRLAKDTGIEPPRVRRDGTLIAQGLGREQMWRTMRMLREFSPIDLAVQASTEETAVSVSTVQEYCTFLTRAGYLTVVRRGQGVGKGGVPAIYRFVPSRNTGPQPPMIQRIKQVYDPNLGKVVWSSEEVCHD